MRWIRPQRTVKSPTVKPAFPWTGLDWPNGVTISVSAGFGVGKSSAAALLGLPCADGSPPILKNWITTEQDPEPVYAMFQRLGVPCPNVWSADPLDPTGSVSRAIKSQLSGPGDVTVLDSTTPLGIQGAVEIMQQVIQDGLQTGRRYLLINQQNKASEIYGAIKLAFMPDVVVDIDVDLFGRRRLNVTKNRHGPPSTTYFEMTRTGKICQPDFSAIAHSVEGSANNLSLMPYGLQKGARWAGMFKVLDGLDLLPQLAGYAAAACPAPTPTGFIEPPDVSARRALAESHGLKWIDPHEAANLIKLNEPDPEPKEAA